MEAVLSDGAFVSGLARRLMELLDHEESDATPVALGAFTGLTSSCSDEVRSGLATYANAVAIRSRSFLRSTNAKLVQNACRALAALGSAADLSLLAELRTAREAKTREAAASAYDVLKRRVAA
jgi:hypothetical protein